MKTYIIINDSFQGSANDCNNTTHLYLTIFLDENKWCATQDSNAFLLKVYRWCILLLFVIIRPIYPFFLDKRCSDKNALISSDWECRIIPGNEIPSQTFSINFSLICAFKLHKNIWEPIFMSLTKCIVIRCIKNIQKNLQHLVNLYGNACIV